MNPLFQYLLKLLREHLHSHPVLVWYDPRREFEPFVDELGDRLTVLRLGTSHLALKLDLEPHLAKEKPGPLVVYLPGITRKEEVDLLAEVVAMSKEWSPQLRQLARQVLAPGRTAGQIDQIFAEEPGYADLCRLLDQGGGGSSWLQRVFPQSGSEEWLARWLADTGCDAELEKPTAREELKALVKSRLAGLDLEDGSLAKWRLEVLSFVLGNEFRQDLSDPALASIGGLAQPANKEVLHRIRQIAILLRERYAGAYLDLAQRVEAHLAIRPGSIPAAELGRIDTFPFEEVALFELAAQKLQDEDYEAALHIAQRRHGSIWLREPQKGLRWTLLETLANLGMELVRVGQDLRKPPRPIDDWILTYSHSDGWHRMDGLFRTVRILRGQIDDLEGIELPLNLVEARYEDLVDRMSQAFLAALEKSEWQFPSQRSQSRFWDTDVPREGRVAVFLVDALRLEMGWSLLQQLEDLGTWSLKPRVAMAPTITPVGMAAVLPSGGLDFQVGEADGAFAGRWGGQLLPGLKARQTWLSGRVPGVQDLTLQELMDQSPTTLQDRLGKASVVVVRSQEIDAFGEGGAGAAIAAMDQVLPQLRRAVSKLVRMGWTEFRIVADHGFLLGRPKNESMRIDPPQGGQTVDLHRRCWVGRSGATPANCVRLRGADLGYATDLEFVFPKGAGVFKAGGDLSFHHGGLSLQELVIPVLTGSCKPAKPAKGAASQVVVHGLERITNRMIVIKLEHEGSLLDLPVRLCLLSQGRDVGRVAMVQPETADHDKDSGVVTIKGGKAAVVCLQLVDDTVTSVRLQVLDSHELDILSNGRDIPVELGL